MSQILEKIEFFCFILDRLHIIPVSVITSPVITWRDYFSNDYTIIEKQFAQAVYIKFFS